MPSLRNSILSDANLDMLEDLSIKKIYNISGILLNKDDLFFKDNFMMVTLAVIKEEEKKRTLLTITKINGIIIKEVINFIIHCINNEKQEPEELSTKLDPDEDDFFEELKTDIITQRDSIPILVPPVEELKPLFKDDMYYLETGDMDKTIDGFVSSIKLDNIKEIQMMDFSIDNSDYIVTEYNNTFAIDDINITIECGNYTGNEIEEEIQQQIVSKIDDTLEFKMKKKTDSFYIQSTVKKTKSLTGSLKEQKSYHIDFGTLNSINKLLGFEAKSYKLKSDDMIEGVKHRIGYNQYVNILINCGSHELRYKILMDVGYNKTKYFVPKTDNLMINNDNTTFNVDSLSIKITDMYGNIYNTRGRRFNISFRINQLKN